MTIHLRDRLADELDRAVDVTEDLAPGVVVRGRARRRRRGVASALAVAAIAVGATWTGSVLTDDDPGATVVADQPVPAEVADVRADWDALLASYFGSALPDGFTLLAQSRGPEMSDELLGDGPSGDVQLNATVYLGRYLPPPSCVDTTAQECSTVATDGSGTAVVLRNIHTDRPDMPQASQVFVDRGNVQAIVNIVENELGPSQYSLADLTGLATSDVLPRLLDLASANADALGDYGVT